jgi:chromosome segregation ATPase
MAQTTDREIEEIKATVDTLVKAIGELTIEMRVGFAKLEGKIEANTEAVNKLDAKLEKVETKLDNKLNALEGRLWAFQITILVATLTALLAIFGRFLFANFPAT